MIKKINNDTIKLIIINIIMLIFTILIRCFYDKLWSVLILFKISPFILILINIFLLVKSIKLIIKNSKKIFEWIPLFILISGVSINFLYDSLYEKNLYRINLEKRNEVVRSILSKNIYTTDVYSERLEDDNSKISCNGKVYIHRNTDEDALIEFCISFGFPDGGSSIVYSTGNEKYIKEYITSVNRVRKLDTNWYYVYFK